MVQKSGPWSQSSRTTTTRWNRLNHSEPVLCLIGLMFWGTVNGNDPHTLCCTAPGMAIESSKIPMELQIVPAGSEKSQNISHTCKEFETSRCTEAFHQSCEWMMIMRNNLRTEWQRGQQAQSSSFYVKLKAICKGWTRDLHSPTSRHISTTIHWRRSAANVCEVVPHFNLWELNFELVLVRCELAQHCSPLYIVFSHKKKTYHLMVKRKTHMGITNKHFQHSVRQYADRPLRVIPERPCGLIAAGFSAVIGMLLGCTKKKKKRASLG